MYFGFTHCPDICPEEMEKLVKVVNILDEAKNAQPIIPVFITVDASRDSPANVKKYIQEFSPKMVGFTGSLEQVKKVCKTFRVYHSQGPKSPDEDYIVDHTVIMYLIDPDGQFVDYYGQNRTHNEIADVIKLQQLKYSMRDKKWW